MKLTIFTPAYNRANLLVRLYNSLLVQENRNFEWIIIDDGSTDNTQEIVHGFIHENKISIIFEVQKNSGKHIAINRASELANGELFFIVDSDDYLVSNATKIIEEKYKLISNNDKFGGICGRKGHSLTRYIGSDGFAKDLVSNFLDFRFKHKVKGDMAEVIKTTVLREFLFPVINGQKFCTEGLLWTRVAEKYNILFFPDIIYIAEYLEDGLTSNIFKIRKESPDYAMLYYSGLEKMKIPFHEKVKANINYWRFAKYSTKTFGDKIKDTNLLLSIIGLPLSLVFLIKDQK